MAGQQFFNSCVASSLLQEELLFLVLGERDIATADDEDHAHFFVCQILGP